MIEDFRFQSGGERIAGGQFLPNGRPSAAIVLTGPVTSVKEQACSAYARALAARGFAALAFDHRYFGESGGEPRQFENPLAKIEDIRAAAAAIRVAPDTRGLPIAGVGICAGAGYMAHAVATELAFSAFAGVAGFYPEATAGSAGAAQPRLARGLAAERKWIELRKIAALADTFGITIAPHLFPELNVHLLASIPNCIWCENMALIDDIWVDPPEIANGMIAAPERPGHGLKFKDEVLKFKI